MSSSVGTIEDAQAYLAAIVDSSEDAIIGKTIDGIITFWNAGAEKLFGYSRHEIIGKSILTLIPADRHREEEEIIRRLRNNERINHFETVRVRKDGTPVDISLTVSPIRDASGKVIGASKIARDISSRKRIESDRRKILDSERAARMEAERAARLRDEFLATVSHELRTPLNGVLGWTQLLRRLPRDDPSWQEGLDAIERGARAQARLIDDLLDMSRIISGKLRLDIQTVEILPIVEAAIETIRPAAELKGIAIERILEPRSGRITGDPARIQQILWNLLSNAVKFTPNQGRIRVHLDQVDTHVRIIVRDTGKGISQDFLPHVFDRFSQADGSATRKHGGLGLGLAVARHLVELHGGRIWAESEGENLGATFGVQLPIPASLEDDGQVADHKSDDLFYHGTLTNLGILVVDDDPDTCGMLRRVLHECGANVHTAASASEALNKFGTVQPDVLVSDIGMPDMDGYDLIRELRRNGSRLPAIAVTAFARTEDRIRALQAGYNMHVAKPLEPRELIEVIAALWRSKTTPPPVHRNPAPCLGDQI